MSLKPIQNKCIGVISLTLQTSEKSDDIPKTRLKILAESCRVAYDIIDSEGRKNAHETRKISDRNLRMKMMEKEADRISGVGKILESFFDNVWDKPKHEQTWLNMLMFVYGYIKKDIENPQYIRAIERIQNDIEGIFNHIGKENKTIPACIWAGEIAAEKFYDIMNDFE